MDKEQLGSAIEMLRDDMIDAHAEMTVSTDHMRAVLDALEAALERAEGAPMIAQTYCGRLREFPLLCNPEDGPCPSCLRAHIAKLEARNAELEAQAEAQAGGVVVSCEELEALNEAADAGDSLREALYEYAEGNMWLPQLRRCDAAKASLADIRAAKGVTP